MRELYPRDKNTLRSTERPYMSIFIIPVSKRDQVRTSINFDCFGEEDIQVNFDTQKTDN